MLESTFSDRFLGLSIYVSGLSGIFSHVNLFLIFGIIYNYLNIIQNLRAVNTFICLQIAALSPADICYEETLSTLRYAERCTSIMFSSLVLVQIAVRWLGKMTEGTNSH